MSLVPGTGGAGCSGVLDILPLSSPQQPWGLAGILPCLGVWGQGTSAAALGASL